MRILFVMRSIRPFHYHREVIRELCRRGHTVRGLFDYAWSRSKLPVLPRVEAFQAATPGFSWEWAQTGTGWFSRSVLLAAREILSYANYVRMPEQSRYYQDRWRTYIPYSLRRLIEVFPWTDRVLVSTPLQWSLGMLERLVPADRYAVAYLRQFAPDVVLASPVNLRYSSADLEYLKAALGLGIPTGLQVMSWDNLTTKGLIHAVPDMVLVWNKTQAEEVVRCHGVARDRIRITGAPGFDIWFSRLRPSQTREIFCRAHGLDPAAPIVIYLGSSRNIAENETSLVRSLRVALSTAPERSIRRVQLVVRPHPANAKVYAPLASEGVAIIPRTGSLPDSTEAIQLFHDTLQVAVATVGVNTSGMIDAIANGKPVIAFLTEEFRKTQSEAQHFQHLVESGALECVATPTEFLKVLGRILAGEDLRAPERAAFIAHFIRPQGTERPASAVFVDAIENFVAARKTRTGSESF